jgi:hypothetical protein
MTTTHNTRLWLARVGLATVGLGAGTFLGHFATAARYGAELGAEHGIGFAVGVIVSLFVAIDR